MRRSRTAWPDDRPFALFLSHDIDEVYDRELFRILGDFNHLCRVWTSGEQGSTALCIKRIARSLLRPRPPGHDIETILSIEREHGFESTFFLLEDRTFNRFGGRYTYGEQEVVALARRIREAGCEIAVHGAYHNANDPEMYRAQARSFKRAFGKKPAGIRNHYLLHAGSITWTSQYAAEFEYDATFGYNDRAGVREDRFFPFFPLDHKADPKRDFVVLPLTIMDCSIFNGMRLPTRDAFSLCRRIALAVERKGGLLSLLWHNNYFNEPEYEDWQSAYVDLLDWLAGRNPWNATGEKIASWWRSRQIAQAR